MFIGTIRRSTYCCFLFLLIAALIGKSTASLGDHLPDFKECVKVHQPEPHSIHNPGANG